MKTAALTKPNLLFCFHCISKYTLSCRTQSISSSREMLFSECNRNCSCSAEEWDPVCSDSGITYMSPCLAGCLSSSGQGKNTVSTITGEHRSIMSSVKMCMSQLSQYLGQECLDCCVLRLHILNAAII